MVSLRPFVSIVVNSLYTRIFKRIMFYFWHTAIVMLFLGFSFFLGFKLGKNKSNKKEKINDKCPMGFN
jgi:hypothetical protein